MKRIPEYNKKMMIDKILTKNDRYNKIFFNIKFVLRI